MKIPFIHGDCGDRAADGIGGSCHTGIIGVVGWVDVVNDGCSDAGSRKVNAFGKKKSFSNVNLGGAGGDCKDRNIIS